LGNVSINHFRRFRSYLAGILLERRWLLPAILFLFAIIFEILEHQDVDNPVDVHFVREVIFFGIIYPVGVGILLNALLQFQAERNASLRQQEIEQRLNQELLTAYNWEELRLKVIHFLAAMLPVTGVSLFTSSEESHNLKFETEWWLVTAETRHVLRTIPHDYCGVANHALVKHAHVFEPGDQAMATHSKGYCLPLFHNTEWIGVIHVHLPVSESLTTEQINNLNALSPTIALAIRSSMQGSLSTVQFEAVQNERKRIARHLHDTLGQNLAYLRLMLDKMRMNGNLQEINTIQKELERMQDVANEANEQIRHTMDTLRLEKETQLADLLLAQAQEVSKETGFKLQHNMLGEPFTLPFNVQRKIHAIFREALYNVRRHAQAKTVQLSMHWNAPDGSLTILLTDDGVGFDAGQDPRQGHFGLLIMRQRAEEIGGELNITSEPGKRTQVELRWKSG
jgi:signal transduction histidine kinase